MTAAGPCATLQIPTTLPTLDEMLGRPDLPGADPVAVWEAGLAGARPGSVQVITLHAEVEGLRHAALLESALVRLRAAGPVRFTPPDAIALGRSATGFHAGRSVAARSRVARAG
jgi:hypothetical protein